MDSSRVTGPRAAPKTFLLHEPATHFSARVTRAAAHEKQGKCPAKLAWKKRERAGNAAEHLADKTTRVGSKAVWELDAQNHHKAGFFSLLRVLSTCQHTALKAQLEEEIKDATGTEKRVRRETRNKAQEQGRKEKKKRRLAATASHSLLFRVASLACL